MPPSPPFYQRQQQQQQRPDVRHRGHSAYRFSVASIWAAASGFPRTSTWGDAGGSPAWLRLFRVDWADVDEGLAVGSVAMRLSVGLRRLLRRAESRVSSTLWPARWRPLSLALCGFCVFAPPPLFCGGPFPVSYSVSHFSLSSVLPLGSLRSQGGCVGPRKNRSQ